LFVSILVAFFTNENRDKIKMIYQCFQFFFIYVLHLSNIYYRTYYMHTKLDQLNTDIFFFTIFQIPTSLKLLKIRSFVPTSNKTGECEM